MRSADCDVEGIYTSHFDACCYGSHLLVVTAAICHCDVEGIYTVSGCPYVCCYGSHLLVFFVAGGDPPEAALAISSILKFTPKVQPCLATLFGAHESVVGVTA